MSAHDEGCYALLAIVLRMAPMTAIRMPPPTPPPATLARIDPMSRLPPPPAAAAPRPRVWRMAPPIPPPRIPTIESPRVPRLLSFMRLPATLPPAAPPRRLMMRLTIFKPSSFRELFLDSSKQVLAQCSTERAAGNSGTLGHRQIALWGRRAWL